MARLALEVVSFLTVLLLLDELFVDKHHLFELRKVLVLQVPTHMLCLRCRNEIFLQSGCLRDRVDELETLGVLCCALVRRQQGLRRVLRRLRSEMLLRGQI